MSIRDNISQYEILENVLNNLKEKSLSSRDKGEKFERLCKTILENAPVFKSQVQEVWMYKDFHGKFDKDDGIDLVVLKRNGSYVAVQCKFYDRDYTAKKSDIDTFIAASLRHIQKRHTHTHTQII